MLTDEEIEKLAKPYITSVGDYWCSEKAMPDNGKIEDFARAVIAANNAKVLADIKPESLDFPEYHSQAMGCGLEDRNIRDRYEAMQYGWDCAIDRCQEAIPDDWYSAAQVSALTSAMQGANE